MSVSSSNHLEQAGRVQRMWSEVPPEVFEHAPSSTGLFEQEEIAHIGRLLADCLDETKSELMLLGCATAFREMAALRYAKKLAGVPVALQKVVAIDMAPQLLTVAQRRLQKLQDFGIARDIDVVCGSISEVDIDSHHGLGVAFLGVYDLDCLLRDGIERNEEPVGLEEYGGGMRAILGTHTSILPLIAQDGHLKELEQVIQYESDSNTDFPSIRKTLLAYREGRNDIVGMRVYISHQKQESSIRDALFVSTWFDLDALQRVFCHTGLSCAIHPTNAKKGSVLEIRSTQSSEGKNIGVCALAMNNVLGNVATGSMMTQVLEKLKVVCSGESR